MEDGQGRRSRRSIVLSWFWTLWSGAILLVSVAAFVEGLLEGWTLAALILAGAAIIVCAGSLAAHVMVVRHVHRSRSSSSE
ncbi:hypothetical protein [Leifsonia aquatica]|uniref:hypothetical protein n=1 Tax=Leifsonia aquatica TaxID=144185 RepID=UPI0038201090